MIKMSEARTRARIWLPLTACSVLPVSGGKVEIGVGDKKFVGRDGMVVSAPVMAGELLNEIILLTEAKLLEGAIGVSVD